MLKSKDIADILGVETVTVRKYAKALEDAGYIVQRSESGHREYTQVDATVFRELQTICEQTGMTVERSAFAAVARAARASASVAPVVVSQENQVAMQYEQQYGEVMEIMQNQQELIQRQAAELDRLHKRMDDQNTNLTAILREVLETRRMVAAAQHKKHWWQRKKIEDHEPDPEAQWKRKQEIKEGKY